MTISPDHFDHTPPYDLLREVELGRLGFDCRLIRSLVARPKQTLGALKRLASEIHEDRVLELDAQIFDLYRHFNVIDGVPYYLREVNQYSGDIPDHVVDAFLALGPRAVEPLLEEYDRAEKDRQPNLVFLLAALHVPHPRIESLIKKTIAHDPYEGALCGELYGQPSLVPALEEALTNLPESAELERRTVGEAIESLDSPSERPQPGEFDIFSLYPDEALPAFDALDDDDLSAFLDLDDETLRAGAALSCVDTSYGDKLFEKLLDLAVNDLSPRVRSACYRALGERDDERARIVLHEVLSRREVTLAERAGAVLGLAQETADPQVHRAVLALYENPESRAAALEAMWRSLDDRYRDYFPINLRSEDDDVRRQAVQGVGLYQIGSCAIELIPMMQEPAVRKEAIFAYALAAPVKGRFSVKDAYNLFEKIDELAGGLSEEEHENIEAALDLRLQKAGRPPEFSEEGGDDDEPLPGIVPPLELKKVGRNDPCPCGSGKKYKKCCGASA